MTTITNGFVTSNYNKIPLKTLLSIRDNNYLSKDSKREYHSDRIDALIIEKESKLATKEINKKLNQLDEYQLERDRLKKVIRTLRLNLKYFEPDTIELIKRDLTNEMVNHI